MHRRSQFESLFLATTMLCSALFVLLSIVSSLFPYLQSISLVQQLGVPGAFLFQSFSFMALYPVLYLAYNGILIGRNKDTTASLLVSSLLFLPMFSLSILLRLMFDSSFPQTLVGSWMIGTFTISGSISIAAIASLILMLLLFYLSTSFKAREESKADDSNHQEIPLLPQETVSDEQRIPLQSFLQTEMVDFTSKHSEVDNFVPEENEVITLNFNREHAGGAHQHYAPHEAQPERAQALVDIDVDDYLPQDLLPDSDYADDFPPKEHAHANEDYQESPVLALDNAEQSSYEIPVEGVLHIPSTESYWLVDESTKEQATLLRNTLSEFGIEAKVTGIRKGPVITMFELLPAPGVKLSRIVNLADNIALSLAAANVRIVAPVPGKHAVGIELPNKKRHLVTFSEILLEEAFKNEEHALPVALGKDITGEAQIIDLAKTPHLLIAGATGAGKSVCVNSLISSLLYRRGPEEVKMLLIDPKIVELKFYNDIPHLLTPVITNPKRAFQALKWCLVEMERRYGLLDSMAVRDIENYNKKASEKGITATALPYIVVIVDEFADLMASSGKELESTLARLAAMSRAVGIHLVLATQRPSTDVITGLIKANIPSRIAFMVASKVDSRIIIDAVGAEKLLGKGDMLLTSAWDPFPQRIQGAYLSEGEIERIVSHVKTMGAPQYIDDEIFFEDDDESYDQDGPNDPLMEAAMDIVYSANKASASYLQRRLSIGYNRAARLIENMETMGIIGPPNGSKPRDILRSR